MSTLIAGTYTGSFTKVASAVLAGYSTPVANGANIRSSLFNNGEKGVWFDPSDFSTLFQDSAGTTPVTAVGQPVGLLLDKSQGLVVGANILIGTGSANSPWTYVSDVITRNGATTGIAQSNAITVSGTTYLITFDVSNLSGDTFYIRCGNVASGNISANGSYTFRITATAAVTAFQAAPWAGTAGQVTISNISVKAISGNHATQATSTARPILGRHPITGVRNLLTYTEDFSNAVWNKSNVTSTYSIADPFGGTTAIRITATAANGAMFQVGQIFSGQFTGSLWLRRVSGSGVINMIAPDNAQRSVSPTSQWTRFSETGTLNSINIYIGLVIATSGDVIEVAFSQVEAGPTPLNYQKVVSQFDITEAGVNYAYYLYGDGVDNSMVTPSIDFTATSAMSVFAGVRKLSDASIGMLVELSADSTSTNPGSFYLANFTNSKWGDLVHGATGQATNTTSAFAAPITNVLSANLDIAASTGVPIRVNGTVPTQTPGGSATGGGNFGNYPLYLLTRAGASLQFLGKLYGLIVRGAASSASEIAAAEQWMNSKTGAY